jgi:hypothetical protein
MKKSRRSVSGIYVIAFPDERVYVGGSLHRLYERVQEHIRFLWDGIHPNKALQSAFCEYGGRGLRVTLRELEVQTADELVEAEAATMRFHVEKRGRENVLNQNLEPKVGDYECPLSALGGRRPRTRRRRRCRTAGIHDGMANAGQS